MLRIAVYSLTIAVSLSVTPGISNAGTPTNRQKTDTTYPTLEASVLFTTGADKPFIEATVPEADTELVQATGPESTTVTFSNPGPETTDIQLPVVRGNSDNRSTFLDNAQFSIGAESFRSFGDGRYALFNPLPFATANSQGAVATFNTTVRLFDSNIYGQVGTSYGVYDWRGRTINSTTLSGNPEEQWYFTYGVFKRSNVCKGDRISWGLVSDHFYGTNYGWTVDSPYLHQLRGVFGFAVDHHNEVGVSATVGTNQDRVGISSVGAGITTSVRAMNQLNAYLKHNWKRGGNSTVYVGALDNADIASWHFGMLNTSPLNDYVSLYGNFGYVVPGASSGLAGAAEEQWNLGVGLVFSVGGKAVTRTVSGHQGTALLPVASNGTFLMTN